MARGARGFRVHNGIHLNLGGEVKGRALGTRLNNIPVFVHVLCTVKAQVSSSPDAGPMVHKNEKQTCHCLSASAGKFCNFLRQFLR